MAQEAVVWNGDGRCPLCGSDDLAKADAIMAETKISSPEDLRDPQIMDAYLAKARVASALRRPHMDGECLP